MTFFRKIKYAIDYFCEEPTVLFLSIQIICPVTLNLQNLDYSQRHYADHHFSSLQLRWTLFFCLQWNLRTIRHKYLRFARIFQFIWFAGIWNSEPFQFGPPTRLCPQLISSKTKIHRKYRKTDKHQAEKGRALSEDKGITDRGGPFKLWKQIRSC